MVDLFNWPKFRLTKSVFFRARAVNRGTHVYPCMSKGYLQPLVIFIFWCHTCACKFMPARQFLLFKEGITEKNIFFKFLVGVELATSESAVQCLLYWATAAGLDLCSQKLIFNSKCRFQAPLTFQNGHFASSIYLQPVSIMLATATPQ